MNTPTSTNGPEMDLNPTSDRDHLDTIARSFAWRIDYTTPVEANNIKPIRYVGDGYELDLMCLYHPDGTLVYAYVQADDDRSDINLTIGQVIEYLNGSDLDRYPIIDNEARIIDAASDNGWTSFPIPLADNTWAHIYTNGTDPYLTVTYNSAWDPTCLYIGATPVSLAGAIAHLTHTKLENLGAYDLVAFTANAHGWTDTQVGGGTRVTFRRGPIKLDMTFTDDDDFISAADHANNYMSLDLIDLIDRLTYHA